MLQVSVLMPVLNPHPVHFPAAVASIVRQSLRDWELIVVEDPSAESAAEHLAAFDDPRIRHVVNPVRTSLVDQLNQGLALATADLVARFDADDVCEEQRLSEHVARLASDDRVDLIGSQLAIIDEIGAPQGFRDYPTTHASIVGALPRYNPMAHPSVTFRKAAVLSVGGYTYRTYPAEDYDLWCRLAAAGARFANHHEALVRYRIDPSAMKLAKLREMLRGTLDIKRRHWSGRMDLAAKARFHLEQSLLAMPPGLLLKLFRWTQFRAA